MGINNPPAAGGTGPPNELGAIGGALPPAYGSYWAGDGAPSPAPEPNGLLVAGISFPSKLGSYTVVGRS